jgi:hypothetical protein
MICNQFGCEIYDGETYAHCEHCEYILCWHCLVTDRVDHPHKRQPEVLGMTRVTEGLRRWMLRGLKRLRSTGRPLSGGA